MLDLKIVNGMLIDGTGAEAVRMDVGVRDGRIVELSQSLGAAERTIDAEGATVTPGFVDIHTHYDGQVSWDADLAPSSLHGVTTCVMGSCGVGFAPVRDHDHQRLIELMEGVEDIPGTALAEGLTWGWQTFAEYMKKIDSFAHTIDFAAHIGHDPLRMFVMGERATAHEPATDDEILAMRTEVRAALDAGAVGFSTGRSDNHRIKSGAPTPASEAAARELIGIAKAFDGSPHGVLQAVSDFDMNTDPERFDIEFDVLEEMAKAAGGHSLSVSTMQRDPAPMQWKQIMARAERAQKNGLDIRMQVAPRPIGVLLGLQATFHPFMGFPSYKALAHLPLAERVKELKKPEVRARMLKEKTDKVAGDGSPIPPLADELLAKLDMVSLRLFRMSKEPNYEPTLEDSLYAEAQAKGSTALEVVYDALLEDEGRALLYFPLYNYTEFSLDNVHEMMVHPLSLPGLSDGGAHVGTICDASFPSFLLSYWVRDRKSARISLPRAVQMLTGDTSKYIGFEDRGIVAVGKKADLNVIDFDALRLTRPHMVKDLPAGGQRLLQRAQGFRATVVSGQVIVVDGAFTGTRPGRLVRSGPAGAGA